MLKKEWKNLLNNKFLIVALIAIITIPTIYTTLFLGSMWDPYGKIDNLPVAVVNNDVAVNYEDIDVNVGERLVDSLKENDSLAFNFVDNDDAKKGLENGTYYMVITIPKDFSKNATTLLDKKPKKMVLDYATNPGKNYIASKMGQTALSKVQNTIAKKVTETYADTVFAQFEVLGDGLREASDGSLELKGGLGKLQDGSLKINDGLDTLSSSMLTFTDGTTTLSQGLDTYLTGVESLNSASKELAAGASKLATGANQLNSAVANISIPNISLSDEQKNTLKDTAVSSVAGPSNQLSDGIGNAVSSKINSTLTSDKTLGAVSTAILNNSDIVQMVGALQSVGYTKEQAEGLVVGIVSNSLKGASSNITSDSITNSISPTVSKTIGQIAGKAAESGAQAVVKEVNSNLSTYEEMFGSLKASTKTLSQGLDTLSSGASRLNEGANKLVSNNSSLKNGVSSLSAGSNKISTGVNDLLKGSLSLTDGLGTALDGTNTLQTSLDDGAKDVKKTTSTIDNDTLDMFASPVDSSETQITTVLDNGHAMAAYMMVVGLWVGAMGFCTIYPLTAHDGKIKSGFRLWLSKSTIMYPVAILSSMTMIAALSYFNGFNPVDLNKTMLVAATAAVTFMSMVYLLNVAFGKVGKFLVLVLMVIQLSGSTGTYPLELSGDFVAKITNYLPFTHVVKAFRNTISGGPSIENNLIFLGSVALVCIILTILVLELRIRFNLNKDNFADSNLDDQLVG
ncbi:MAG: YhgE/Pip domain-containing protein [Terrisporobacter sp.]